MKKNQYEFPKSSFLSLAKDSSLIMDKILKNKTILKLLYYATPDWKIQEDLNPTQIKSLFSNKQISNVPTIRVDNNNLQLSYLRITFDEFFPNAQNGYYRDSVVNFKVACPFDCWDLNDFELRPYRIAGELDSMFNDTYLTGIGKLTFLGADMDIYDDYIGGVTLRYLAVHGNDDKIDPLV